MIGFKSDNVTCIRVYVYTCVSCTCDIILQFLEEKHHLICVTYVTCMVCMTNVAMQGPCDPRDINDINSIRDMREMPDMSNLYDICDTL